MFNNSFALGVSISSLLICVVNLVYTLILRRTDKLQNRLFIALLCILIVNSLTGIVSAVCGNEVASEQTLSYLSASRYAYFATHTALCPLFFYYVSNVSLASTRLTNRRVFLLSLPFFVTEMLALTNPITSFVWTFDETMAFHREWGETVIYITALFYFVLAFSVIIRSWDFISKKRRTALIFLCVMVVIGVLIQLLHKALKVEVLAEAVGFTGVMMSVENEDDRIDFGMGFYNRTALSMDIGGCITNGRSLKLVMIRILNYDLVNRLVGTGEANTVADILSGFLKSVVPRYFIYVPEKDTLVLTLYDYSDAEAEVVAERIFDRFDGTWDYGEYSIQLNASILIADVPSQIRSTAELSYMIESPVPDTKENRIFKEKDLEFIMRRQSIEDAISRGFSENSYEVYYQPTYHIDRKLHGAEALIRMHDKTLGNLYPDEFIPIAEQNGLIDDIDEFVLEEVCRFLKTGVPQKYGIDNINVNLSVLQCMRPGFVDRINRIVAQYGIDKHLINFEITESIAASDYDTLSHVIQRLRNEGFLFSMDDYGTGYSNVSNIFSLNFDVIKIDKSLLWDAEKSELGMVILESTIRMIQKMNKKILVEGVETEAQIHLLEGLKIDYLQGFYFSKPIPKNSFIELISEQKR